MSQAVASTAPDVVADRALEGAWAVPVPASGGGAPLGHRRSDRLAAFLTRLWARSPRWTAPLMMAVCLTGGVAYTLLTHPTQSGAFDSPTCLVKLTTGFDCPGCGGTRAFWYLLHGNIPAAARSHLVVVFAAPFLLYMYVAWTLKTVAGWRLPMLRFGPRAVSIFLAAWAGYAVLRNLPWPPFTWFFV